MASEITRRGLFGATAAAGSTGLIGAWATHVLGAPASPFAPTHPGRPPIQGPKVDVLDEVVISPEPHCFSAWPVVQKLANGCLVVSYAQHPQYYEKIHNGPTNLPMITHSTDSGKTWDKYPTVIGNYRYFGNEAFTITALADGSLLAHVLMMRWHSAGWSTGGHPFGRVAPGDLLQFRSEDGGAHWSLPTKVETGDHKGAFAMRPAVSLGGELLLAYAAEWDLPRGCFLIRSPDHGRTWGKPTIIARKSSWFFTEPSLLALKSGRLLCSFRTNTNKRGNNVDPGYIRVAHSEDGGKTWADPRSLGHFGYPQHLLQLEDGRVVCIYGHRIDPISVRVLISTDDGKTWNGPQTVATLHWADMGYPTAVPLDDGSLFAVYYGYDSRPGWIPRGGTCQIWGVRFAV